jgi:predicted branched-subunit amino acid permease
MDEIFAIIKSKTRSRRAMGYFMVSLGLVLYLIPLVPGSWAIIIGLEVLGIRLLVLDKFKTWTKNSKYFKRWAK